jgi:hypothetical protein
VAGRDSGIIPRDRPWPQPVAREPYQSLDEPTASILGISDHEDGSATHTLRVEPSALDP